MAFHSLTNDAFKFVIEKCGAVQAFDWRYYELRVVCCQRISSECLKTNFRSFRNYEKTDYLKLYCTEIDIKRAALELENGNVLNDLKLEFDKKWTLLTINDKMQGFLDLHIRIPLGMKSFWRIPSLRALMRVPPFHAGMSRSTKQSSISMEIRQHSTHVLLFGGFRFGGVRIHSSKKDQGAFALDLAGKCLDYYSEWFGIPCPLPKCDLIAIPDFCMGAMENWGLVTYREVCLLVDQLKSSTRGKQGVALTVAHELGHFWFGNLVTMKWWTDLWLKEGFASFMEYMAVDKLCPEFNIWRSFLDYEVASGFSLDSMRNSHPIEDVNALMSSWTKQMGKLPLVSVEQEVEGKERVLKLQQARFIADGGADEMKLFVAGPHRNNFCTDPSKPVSKLLFTKKKDVFTVNDLKPTDWIRLIFLSPSYFYFLFLDECWNFWFYRVHYSDEMLGALLRAVESKQMLVADRFGLAQDLFALVESGKIAVSSFLKFVAASSNEDEYIVWTAVDGGSPVSRTAWSQSSKVSDGNRIKTKILRAQANNRTSLKKFDDDADLIPDLRKVVFGCAGRSNDKERSAKLQKIFDTCGFSEVENLVSLLWLRRQTGCEKHEVITKEIWLSEQFIVPMCTKKSSSSQSSEAFVADFESFCKDSFDSHEIEVLDRPIKQIVESIRLNVKLLKENAVDMKSFLTTHGQMMK
uniref:Aminopeptidase n=1 Tax=Ditylenchus dipsaci TaxID=166011 RepID=A0A915EHW9_9BILA